MREPLAALHAAYLPVAAFLNQTASWKDSILGLLCNSAQAGSALTDTRLPCARVHMERLDSEDSINVHSFGWGDLSCGVYVRHPADVPQIRLDSARRAGDTLNAVYGHADVCREDLRLEIDGSAAVTLQPACGGRG
jgi:hypothetical protein